MADCDCCRFNGEISSKYDPDCTKTLIFGGVLHPSYSVTGSLSTTISAGSIIKVTGGTGSIRFFRLPHLTFLTSGARMSCQFAIDGTGSATVTRPTIGKQRIFCFGWCLELDWSDETLRAYECDDEGVPTGAAWYEQEINRFWDATNFDATATITLTVTIVIGKVNGTGAWRKVIDVRGIPVASKAVSGIPGSYWVGISAEHSGDDMAFTMSGALDGFICNSSVRGDPGSSPGLTWWCDTMPLLFSLDTTGLSFEFWADKQDHFPDDCLLIPTGTAGNPAYAYTKTPFLDGGTTYGPTASFNAIQITATNRGLAGTLVETRSTGPTLNSDQYRDMDTANYKPPGWDCDPSVSHSIASSASCGGGSGCFTTQLASFDISPVGLITPSAPP